MATTKVSELTVKTALYRARTFWTKTASFSDVRLSSFKNYTDKKTGVLTISCNTSSRKTGDGVKKDPKDIKTYVSRVQGLPKVSVSRIKMHCTCPSFLYHCHRPLFDLNANIENKKLRKITSGPTVGVAAPVCKHLIVMLVKIAQKGL